MPVIALGQSDRKRRQIDVFGCGDFRPTSLAAGTRGVDRFGKIGCPDDIAAEPHAPEETREHRTLGGRGDAQTIQPRPFDALTRREGRHQRGIDHRSDGRTDHAADGRTRKADDGAAKPSPVG